MTDTQILARRTAYDGTYAHVHFSHDIQFVRASFKCCTCGTIQGQYVLPGSENVVSCEPCPSCGETGEQFEVVELIGRVNGEGPEIELRHIYDRDIEPLPKEEAA